MMASAEVSRKRRTGKKSTRSRQWKLSATKIGSTKMGSAHSLESSASNTTVAAAASARATASARASQRVTAYLEMLATGPLPPPTGTVTITIPAKSSNEGTKTKKEEKPLPQYLVPPVDLQSRSSFGKCLKSFVKLLGGERKSVENITKKTGKGTAECLDHSRPRPQSLPVWQCRGWSLSMPRTYTPLRRPPSGSFVSTANFSALSQIHKQPPSDAANPKEVNTKRSHLNSSLDGTRDRKPQGRPKMMDCTDLPWCTLNKARRERPRTAPQQNLGVYRPRVSTTRLQTTSHAATRTISRGGGTTLNKRGSRVATSPVFDGRPLPTPVLAQQIAQETLLQILESSPRNRSLKKIPKPQGQAPKQGGRISPVRELQTRLSKMAAKRSLLRTTRPSTRGINNMATAPKPKRVKYTTFSGK